MYAGGGAPCAASARAAAGAPATEPASCASFSRARPAAPLAADVSAAAASPSPSKARGALSATPSLRASERTAREMARIALPSGRGMLRLAASSRPPSQVGASPWAMAARRAICALWRTRSHAHVMRHIATLTPTSKPPAIVAVLVALLVRAATIHGSHTSRFCCSHAHATSSAERASTPSAASTILSSISLRPAREISSTATSRAALGKRRARSDVASLRSACVGKSQTIRPSSSSRLCVQPRPCSGSETRGNCALVRPAIRRLGRNEYASVGSFAFTRLRTKSVYACSLSGYQTAASSPRPSTRPSTI